MAGRKCGSGEGREDYYASRGLCGQCLYPYYTRSDTHPVICPVSEKGVDAELWGQVLGHSLMSLSCAHRNPWDLVDFALVVVGLIVVVLLGLAITFRSSVTAARRSYEDVASYWR